MNVKLLIKTSEQFLAEHSPAILTGVAVAGTAATAYLSVKAGMNAEHRIITENNMRSMKSEDGNWEVVTTSEKIKMTWKEFLPAGGTAALTIGAIVCANRISAKRLAAVVAAYSLGESKFEEYKDKVAEKFGREAHDEVKESLVQDKLNSAAQTIILGNGEEMIFDAYSGRFFRGTVNAIEKAANEVNQLVFKENYQTLDDFWDLIGLPATAYSVEQGWNADNLLELEWGTMIKEDTGTPCLVLKYDAEPIRGWNH